MAPQLPSQLAPGMASFNQGFKSVGDLMNQIKQHQFERQKLMEAVRQHGEMMGFKRREEGRAQNKENRAQQSFDQKNAIMQELANWFQNKGGNQNQSMGGNTARPAAPNVAASGMPANEQNAMMNDPNTGVQGGEHEVDMYGRPVGGQQAQVPGMVAQGNIDLNNRPMVKNPQGGTSTVLTMGISEDGKHINIPRVSDDGRILTEKEAVDQFHKSGKHLGVFDSQEAADKAAQQLHEDQAQQYGLNDSNSPQSNQPPEELQQRYMLAFGKPFPMASETPDQKRAADLQTAIQTEKMKIQMGDEKEKSKLKLSAKKDIPVIQDSINGVDELIKIAKENKDLFGHYVAPDLFAKTTKNKNAGTWQNLMLDRLAAAEGKLSSKGNILALKVALAAKPGFAEQQQVAVAKLESMKKALMQSLQHSKELSGEQANSPNDDPLGLFGG